MAVPRQFTEDKSLRPGQGNDPASYTVNPDTIERPWLAIPPNGPIFVFPGGVEGFDLTGTAQISSHHPVDGNVPRATVVHRDEARITLSGAFVGDRALDNGKALRQVCIAATPTVQGQYGKLLYVPYALDNFQYVLVESHNIRMEESNTEEVAYNVVCLKIGTAGAAPRINLAIRATRPFPFLRTPSRPVGNGIRKYSATQKYNTLRKIARLKYGDAGLWGNLYSANHTYFEKHDIPFFAAADKRLPLGTKVYF